MGRFSHEKKMLNQDDLNRLCTIYQQKIHKYLETYKVIDTEVSSAELRMQLITGESIYETFHNYREFDKAMLRKYTNLGYKDLRLELRR